MEVPSVQVQVFGRNDSTTTRAAVRFFKERRVEVHLVDLARRPMAAGELRRFVERLGAAALADSEGKAWRDAGLGYLRMDPDELAARLLADQRLLRLPLVRAGTLFAAGKDETAWQRIVAIATVQPAVADPSPASRGARQARRTPRR